MNGREEHDELEAMRNAWHALERRWALSELERNMLLPLGGAMAVPLPSETERRMRLLVQVDYLLHFEEHEVRAWLRAPTADLCGSSPMEVLAGPTAELSRVRRLLEAGVSS